MRIGTKPRDERAGDVVGRACQALAQPDRCSDDDSDRSTVGLGQQKGEVGDLLE